MEFKFRLLDGGHPGIFAAPDATLTSSGEIPPGKTIWIFESWKGYKRLLDAMESFYKEHHTEVPDVFKKAFGEKGKG